MSKISPKTAAKYGITTAVAGLIGWLAYASRISELGAFMSLSLADRYRVLCDTFTVPGLLLILSALMVTVSNEGALDGITYLGHYLTHTLIPGRRASTQKYGDYIAQKREKRVSGYGFLYLVGGACMVLALVFFALFYSVS